MRTKDSGRKHKQASDEKREEVGADSDILWWASDDGDKKRNRRYLRQKKKSAVKRFVSVVSSQGARQTASRIRG